MPAYWVARSKINDPVEYKKYTDLVPGMFAEAHVVIGQHVAGTDDHFRKSPAAIGITCNYLHNARDEAVQEEIFVLSGSNLPTDTLIRRWK